MTTSLQYLVIIKFIEIRLFKPLPTAVFLTFFLNVKRLNTLLFY